MPQVQVSLGAVNGNVTLAVLVWVEGAGINVDIRIQLLDGDRITSCLQQLGEGGRNYTLAQ